MNDFKNEIAKTIRGIREDLGLSQAGLEVLFNKTEPWILQTAQTDISKYERGLTVCPTEKFLKFQSLVG